jgi:hypothetical protein
VVAAYELEIVSNVITVVVSPPYVDLVSDDGNGTGNGNGSGNGNGNGTATATVFRSRFLTIGDGQINGIPPSNLTYANVRDGKVKYKTIRKSKLLLLCTNLLDHIKDLELRHEEELKEAKVEEAKVEKEAAPTGNDDNDGTTTSNGEAGEEDVMGVEEGNNVKVNATSNKSKSAKLAKLVKLAKSTSLLCLSLSAVTGGQGQGQAEAEEGVPGEPPRGGLHGRQLWEQTPPGLPRGRPWQGEDPQVHVHVVAHEDPEGKPRREQHQQQQRLTGQAGRQVPRQARGGVPGRGAQGKNKGKTNDVTGHQLQPDGRGPSPSSTSPRSTARRQDCSHSGRGNRHS